MPTGTHTLLAASIINYQSLSLAVALLLPRPEQHCQGHQNIPGAPLGLEPPGVIKTGTVQDLSLVQHCWVFILAFPLQPALSVFLELEIFILSTPFLCNNFTLPSGAAHTSEALPSSAALLGCSHPEHTHRERSSLCCWEQSWNASQRWHKVLFSAGLLLHFTAPSKPWGSQLAQAAPPCKLLLRGSSQ